MSDEYEPDHGVEEEFPGVTKAADAAVKPPPPPEPTPDLDVLDLDSVATHTQKIRLKVQALANKALAQEVSPDMLNVLLKTASDMDKTVVQRRRVGIDEAAAKTAEESQRDSAAILRAISAKTFQIDPATMDPNRKPPSLGDDVPPPQLVPGETEIGTPQLSYDGFAKDAASQS
jgi:hypothetical protein